MVDAIAASAKWITAVAAFLAATIGFWYWNRDVAWARRLCAMLALLAGVSRVTDIILEDQIAAREALRRTTPPALDGNLTVKDADTLVVNIIPISSIPFECEWVVATEKNVLVGAFMLQFQEFHPDSSPGPYRLYYDYQSERVTNNYLELRLRCRSIFSAQQGYPTDLEVRIAKGYAIEGGKLRKIELSPTSTP